MVLFIVAGLCLLAPPLSADTWPMYRKDPHRSAVTDESLVFPLQKAWSYRCAQAPRPAWPPQPKILNRVDYDYAAQVVVADGIVVFGSSADDTIRALDLTTGKERWRYITGGPVRFAPQIHRGRVYAASDDGVVYCLKAADGSLVWTFRAAPWPDQMVGNERVISRWPCRTGVLVADDIVYTTAGLWPSDGVYIYALDADSGEVRWVNDTVTYKGVTAVDGLGNHQGEFGFTQTSPEGALLATTNVLVVPQGHMNPLRLDIHTGRLIEGAPRQQAGEERAQKMIAAHVKAGKPSPDSGVVERMTRWLADRGPGYPGSGGTWVTIDQNNLHVMTMHRHRTIFLNRWDLTTNEGGGWRHSDKHIPQLAKGVMRTILPGRASLVVREGKIYARNAYDLVLAGDAMLLGERDAVSAVHKDTGDLVWRGEVSGEARGIAVAQGRVIVSTRRGEITCFAPPGVAPVPAPVHGLHSSRVATGAPSGTAAAVLRKLADAGIDQGYCLLLGDVDEELLHSLCAGTRMHILAGVFDKQKGDAMRQSLLDGPSPYGTRVQVQFLDRRQRLPFAQYFANAVVVCSNLSETPPGELYRVLRPCGGILMAPALSAPDAVALLRATGAAADEIAADEEMPAVVRGQLAGANDFNRPVPDPWVKWPLQPLWFGGPAPEDLADQRSGEIWARPAATAYGRYFAQGEDKLNAVDAYNGTVLWTCPLPKLWHNMRKYHGELRTVTDVAPPPPSRRKKMHWPSVRSVGANRDHVYVWLDARYFRNKRKAVVQLDARTGKQLRLDGPYVRGPQISLAREQSWLFAMPVDAIPDTPGIAPSGTDDAENTELLIDLGDDVRWENMEIGSQQEGRTRMGAEDGMLTMRWGDDALEVVMDRRDSDLTRFDLWELFFDFRPLDERYGLHGDGVYAVRLTPPLKDSPARCTSTPRGLQDALEIDSGRDGDTTRLSLRLTLKGLDDILGRRPDSFGFAATFSAHDGSADPRAPIRQRHLFGDDFSAGINNGWANIFRDDVPHDLTAQPPAVAAPMAAGQRPKGWGARGARFARGINDEIRSAQRIHPLTGDLGPKVYRSGTWSCGGPSFSATTIFRRATRPGVGIYDFEDDSGLRFFGGVSASCSSSSIAALGLLIFGDSRFRCDCNPPIKTSLALGPAERVYHEDWALFFDRPVDSRVRHAYLNFGAFGDRRDADRNMWLAVPRDVDRGYGYALRPGVARGNILDRTAGEYIEHLPAGLLVPIEVDFDESLGPYRRNADHLRIAGTERPWIYGSGVAGIRKAVLRLDFMQPLLAARAGVDIVIDGRLDDIPWRDLPPESVLPNTETAVRLCYDAENLYVSAARPVELAKDGEPRPWAAVTTGDDAEVWKDDALEIFLGTRGDGPVVHLALSASGARYDARAEGTEPEDADWTMDWDGGAFTDDTGLSFEMAIPLDELARAGVPRHELGLNVLVDQSDTRSDASRFLGAEARNWNLQTPSSEALASLGPGGRHRCKNFAPLGLGTRPPFPTRTFTVALHFAELDDIDAGRRVFDVKLQGKTVLRDFDIVEAGGGNRVAVVKKFEGVSLQENLELEFTGAGPRKGIGSLAATISAVELRDEAFARPGGLR